MLCVLTTLASCNRKPLDGDCYCNSTLEIPIDIDWTKSGITLQNVTVLFYNSEDGSLAYEHKYEQNDNEIQSYAKLAAGSYTAVVFNELRDQIDYLKCIDYDNLSTLKFENVGDKEPLRSRAETRSYVKASGDLAVAVVKGIEVTDAMIVEAATKAIDTKSATLSSATKATVESLMGVTAEKKNSTIKITAHIIGLHNARMPALIDLVNLADGYYVEGDKNSNVSSTLQFTMNNRTYDDGSTRNGTISTSVTAFGAFDDRKSTASHDSSNPILLDMLFKLVDKEQTEENIVVDVTDIIKFEQMSDGSVEMTIDVSPDQPLTDVEPEGSNGDSAFGSEVTDWDKVDVPLTQE